MYHKYGKNGSGGEILATKKQSGIRTDGTSAAHGAEKLGTDPQTLEAKLRQGGVPGGPGMERLQQIMGDPQAVQSLLRSPQAQALLKSLKKQQK